MSFAGNGSISSPVANIALLSQSSASTTTTTTGAQASGAVASALPSTTQASQYDYYSSPEYQQYYQQYYANAYSQTNPAAYAQQYAAAFYQASGSADPASMYNALYGQSQANAYLPATYQVGITPPAATAQQATAQDANDEEDDDDDDDPTIAKSNKAANTLTYSCNAKMGLNPLIYTNIQQSPYFKNNLFQLKTYHEVIDEIYYNVKHMEPWEKGSRKVSGQTGMCGSVRGVGAGGIISTPFCLLFKLYTLRLTRKQVNGLIRHKDSPFIRGLGFLFIRYTQPPKDLWDWFEPYLDDMEEIDPKAGGGAPMTIGEMVRYFLTKLDWFSTLFPRIPIPIQKEIEEKLREHDKDSNLNSYDDSANSKETNGAETTSKHRSETKYSKHDSRYRRSRSRSPSRNYDKRPRKYEEDRRNDSDRSSHKHKNNRYY